MSRAAIRCALLLAGVLVPAHATAQPAPALDCELGFEGLRFFANALPGAEPGHDGGYDVVTVSDPGRWSVQFYFTMPGHPAHPAATQRTRRLQVTEVWTADSKGCGYGDTAAFAALMADMKSGDTELTNASRIEAEKKKQGQSPLGP